MRSFYTEESFEGIESVLSQGDSPLGRFTPGELKHLIREGLATLSAPQRRVIDLASYEKLPMQEIADTTGESLVNVRHHYYRGLRKLRSFVERPAQSAESGRR